MKIFLMMTTAVFLLSAAFAEQSRRLERTIAVQPNQEILLQGFHNAKMKVTTWDRPEVSVKLSVTISSGDEAQESEYLNSMAIADEASEGSLAIILEKPDDISVNGIAGFFRNLVRGFQFSQSIIIDVIMPAKNALSSDIRYGSVNISGILGEIRLDGTGNSVSLKNCAAVKKVENNYGAIRMENCGGAAKIVSRSSEMIEIGDFSGSIILDADYSTIAVRNMSGDLSIRNVSGNISVEEISGNVETDANYSTISIQRVKGSVGITSRSSNLIRVEHAGSVHVHAFYSNIRLQSVGGTKESMNTIKNQSGTIDVDDVLGDWDIDADYSQMTFRSVKGNVEVKTKSGMISADSVSGNWLTDAQYTTIALRHLRAKEVMIRNSSNPVTVQCVTAPSAISITNAYGNVEIALPGSFSGDVNLQATYGTIESDFPLRMKMNSSVASANGSIGSGSGTMDIETQSGNIVVTRNP